jgi:hypothetical protein
LLGLRSHVEEEEISLFFHSFSEAHWSFSGRKHAGGRHGDGEEARLCKLSSLSSPVEQGREAEMVKGKEEGGETEEWVLFFFLYVLLDSVLLFQMLPTDFAPKESK